MTVQTPNDVECIAFVMRDGRPYLNNDHWPRKILVAADLLREAPREFLSRNDDILCFNAANGHAAYQITHESTPQDDPLDGGSVIAELVSCVRMAG